MTRQERQILRAAHGNTSTWLDVDGVRRWLRAERATPAIERMVAKGWLRPTGGGVYLVTKCGVVPGARS